jgi:hypothetical protein
MRRVLKQIFRLNEGVLEPVDFVSKTAVLETLDYTILIPENNL